MVSVVLFDIDYTLLDTKRLKGFFNREISQLLGIREKESRKMNRRFSERLRTSIEFSPRRYIRFLQNRLGRQLPRAKLIKLFFENGTGYGESLYPETIPVLNRLRKKFSLGIFSEGNREFQMAKLKLSGLVNYLEQKLIFVYPNKTRKANMLVEKLGDICIVDDDPEHIAALIKTDGIFPVWIKRGPRALDYKKADFEPIFSLEEICQRLTIFTSKNPEDQVVIDKV